MVKVVLIGTSSGSEAPLHLAVPRPRLLRAPGANGFRAANARTST
jgi:hypothetical protein